MTEGGFQGRSYAGVPIFELHTFVTVRYDAQLAAQLSVADRSRYQQASGPVPSRAPNPPLGSHLCQRR